MKTEQMRQGDLLFVRISEVPQEAERKDELVIHRGEATGHCHRISNGQQAAIMMVAQAMYIKAFEACTIVHEEHGPAVLPKGDWEVKRQREYEPEGWRYVAD